MSVNMHLRVHELCTWYVPSSVMHRAKMKSMSAVSESSSWGMFSGLLTLHATKTSPFPSMWVRTMGGELSSRMTVSRRDKAVVNNGLVRGGGWGGGRGGDDIRGSDSGKGG